MGTAEHGAVLTLVVFLSTFFLIASVMPAEFNPIVNKGPSIPSYFSTLDMTDFAFTKVAVYNRNASWTYFAYPGGYYLDFELGGHNFRLWDYSVSTGIQHYWFWWIFPTNFHFMTLKNYIGVPMSDSSIGIDDLNAYYADGKALSFTAICDHVYMSMVCGFDETVYASPGAAWSAHNLYVLFGMGIDQEVTRNNGWNLVAQILTFNAPDIHPALNALIAIPIWAITAYLVYVLILKAIPFLGG